MVWRELINMSYKKQIVLAILIFLVGVGGLLSYDLYIQPFVFSKEVVVVKAPAEGLPENYVLEAKDLYLAKITSSNVPERAISNISSVIGKRSSVVLTNGTILTNPLVDVEDLQPGPDEGIYSLPKDSIYAINGSLRSRDIVNVLLVAPEQQLAPGELQLTSLDTVYIEKAKVVYVRTDDNNDVKDTDQGNTTNRITSTGRVSYPELLITHDQGLALKDKLEDGYKLWIVRVN
jgi:hypothetical protein